MNCNVLPRPWNVVKRSPRRVCFVTTQAHFWKDTCLESATHTSPRESIGQRQRKIELSIITCIVWWCMHPAGEKRGRSCLVYMATNDIARSFRQSPVTRGLGNSRHVYMNICRFEYSGHSEFPRPAPKVAEYLVDGKSLFAGVEL